MFLLAHGSNPCYVMGMIFGQGGFCVNAIAC
ncbi:hypothetical protein F383_34559 [Gossypium arboreum]|uniref:Uncharacterized protein n=1 Tax=Gossypium arboreum TaxID=29729 RepID=A0A0B0PMN4_GOSAR|nr:hypothetical protein F383_34559 [Gossypium arboreum]